MDATRAALVAQYVAGPERHPCIARRLTDAELDARPADGGWTAREVVHHTADSEMTSAIRLRRLDRRRRAPDRRLRRRRVRAAAPITTTRPIEPALAAIEGARATTAQILNGLTEAELGEDRAPIPRRARTASSAGSRSTPLTATNTRDQIKRARAEATAEAQT